MSQEMIEAVERIVAAQTFYLPGNFGTRPSPFPIPTIHSISGRRAFPFGPASNNSRPFPDALTLFRKFLQLSAVSPIARNPKDLLLARDYIVGLIIELRRKNLVIQGSSYPSRFSSIVYPLPT